MKPLVDGEPTAGRRAFVRMMLAKFRRLSGKGTRANRPGMRGPWSVLLAWILLVARAFAASSEWASGWTRCPSPVANWQQLAASSDASVIAAFGWAVDEGSPFGRGIGAVSSDFGRSWRLVSRPPEPFPEGPSVVCLSGDGSTLAISGVRWNQRPNGTSVGEAVLMISGDHGATWSRRSLPPEVAPRAPDENQEISDLALSGDGRRMGVAVAGFACLSSDRGLTWKVVQPPESRYIQQIAVSSDGGTFVVGSQGVDGLGNRNVELLLSTDAAATWNRLSWNGVEIPEQLSRVELGGDGRIMVAAVGNSVAISRDQGRTWRSLAVPWSGGVAVSSQGTHVLAAPYNRPWPGIEAPSPLSFTSDSGVTWQAANLGWVPLVAMSDDGSVQVAAMDNGVILINGVLYPPAILDIRREGDLGLLSDRNVTLTVEATGGRLGYQWKKDGALLTEGAGRSGTQGAELRLTPVAEADLGTYSVVVSNAEGSLEREVFTLKLDRPAVSKATQTGSVALVDGAPVTFQVEATGGLLSYQWRRNGTDLEDAPGRTGSRTRELRLAGATVADLGMYSLVVSNSKGSLVTNVGELRLTLPRVVTVQPQPVQAIVPGGTARLQVQVEGGQIEAEWLLNGRPLGRSGEWIGPGTNVLVLTNLQSAALGQHGVRLRNPVGETVVGVGRVTAASWSRAMVPDAAWNAVAMSATGDRLVACAPDRVFASKNGGAAWESWPVPGTDWSSVALGHLAGTVILGQGRNAYVPAQDTFGYRSPDFGNSWVSWNQGTNGEPAWRTTSVASSADGQTVLVSQEIPASGPWGLPIQRSYLRYSHDGGQTWQEATGEIFIAFGMRSATCSDDGRGMAAVRHDFFEGFTIKVSLDGGATWRSSVLPEPVIQAVRISGDGKRLVAIAGRNLYACESSSLAWRRLPAPDANWSTLCLSADGQRIFAADTGSPEGPGVIQQSDDGGQTWRWSGSPSANWTALACSADAERVVGVSAQGIFLAPDTATSVESAVPILAGSDGSGIRFVWQGTPHRTYRLISTSSLDSRPWRSAGAVAADENGRVSVADPAVGLQRFWQAVGTVE